MWGFQCSCLVSQKDQGLDQGMLFGPGKGTQWYHYQVVYLHQSGLEQLAPLLCWAGCHLVLWFWPQLPAFFFGQQSASYHQLLGFQLNLWDQRQLFSLQHLTQESSDLALLLAPELVGILVARWKCGVMGRLSLM